jgi:hypothetical protein
MKAPTCRLCGHAHWGAEHVFGEAEPAEITAPKSKPSASPTPTSSHRKAKVARLQGQIDRLRGAHQRASRGDVANVSHMANLANRSSTTYRYRDVDTRRTYQRDLMRRRRSAKTTLKEATHA